MLRELDMNEMDKVSGGTATQIIPPNPILMRALLIASMLQDTSSNRDSRPESMTNSENGPGDQNNVTVIVPGCNEHGCPTVNIGIGGNSNGGNSNGGGEPRGNTGGRGGPSTHGGGGGSYGSASGGGSVTIEDINPPNND